MVILEFVDPTNQGMSLSLIIKVLLQDLKRCKHWFSYCQKTVLNNYTKEICAKQVATQSDFLMAFLHLEPLLLTHDATWRQAISECSDRRTAKIGTHSEPRHGNTCLRGFRPG